jgi:hypothetical protein
MKYILTITILIQSCLTLLAQENSTRIEIDTIEIYSNRTLVEYREFSDSNLIQKARAFFYPIVFKRPKFRILPNILIATVQADSIVCHGEKLDYQKNRFYKSETYSNGRLLYSAFYDSTGLEISELEFSPNRMNLGTCGIINGQFLFHGKKKRKKN